MTGTMSDAVPGAEGVAAIAAPAPRRKVMKAPVSSFLSEGMGNSFPGGFPKRKRRACPRKGRAPDCLHFPGK